MTKHIHVDFGLCDLLNPDLGYRLQIWNAKSGETILHNTSVRPDNGKDLTLKDCHEVVGFYI